MGRLSTHPRSPQPFGGGLGSSISPRLSSVLVPEQLWMGLVLAEWIKCAHSNANFGEEVFGIAETDGLRQILSFSTAAAGAMDNR